MSSAPPPRLPRAFAILAAVGLLAVSNRYAPGVVQGVLTLVVLYAALTNLPRALRLVTGPERTLRRGFRPPS